MLMQFSDIHRYSKKGGFQPDNPTKQTMLRKAEHDLGESTLAGAILLPLSFLFIVVFSDISLSKIAIFLASGGVLFVGSAFRMIAYFKLKNDPPSNASVWVRLLFIGSILSAMVWGFCSGMAVTTFGNSWITFAVLLISVGIAFGAYASYFIWRNLFLIYIVLIFVPVSLVIILTPELDLRPIGLMMLIYTVFLIRKGFEGNDNYWQSLFNEFHLKYQQDYLKRVNADLELESQAHHRAEQDLRKGHDKLRQIFDSSRDAIFILEKDGSIIDTNYQMLRMFRIVGMDPIGLMSQFFIEPSFFQEESECWKKVLSGTPQTFLNRAINHKGEYLFDCQVFLKKIPWGDRSVVYASLTDITEIIRARDQRDEALDELTKSENFLSAILNNTNISIYCRDLEGTYLTVNNQYCDLVGKPKEAILGKNNPALFPQDMVTYYLEQDLEVAKKKRPTEYEELVILPDGEHSFKTSKFPLFDPDGNVYAVASMSTDVTDMNAALIAAKEASRAKSEFLGNISHELRTPLHGILSFANLGETRVDRLDISKIRRYFNAISMSATRLSNLVNDLLDLSKLEAGKMIMNYSFTPLLEIVQNCVIEQKSVIEERSITLKWVGVELDTTAYIDSARMGQVIANLLSNAIRFTPIKEEITFGFKFVNLDQNIQAIQFSIANTGVPIPECDLESIFDKFVQSSKHRTGSGGSGLGLSISRNIISLHGGRIWADSNSKQGAVFHVVIPLRKGDQLR